jgi:hypothetical protein
VVTDKPIPRAGGGSYARRIERKPLRSPVEYTIAQVRPEATVGQIAAGTELSFDCKSFHVYLLNF